MSNTQSKEPMIQPINSTKLITGVSLIGLAYFGIVNPLLKSIGVKDDASEKKEKELISDLEKSAPNNNYFSPHYYLQIVNNKRAMVFTQASGDMLATKLYKSARWFNDDEAAIFGVFRQCKYKAQVSFIAARFYALYKIDLYLWLKEDVFNESELTNLLKITDSLPTGFIVNR